VLDAGSIPASSTKSEYGEIPHLLLMGLTWFRQREEMDADDPIGDCRKQSKNQELPMTALT